MQGCKMVMIERGRKEELYESCSDKTLFEDHGDGAVRGASADD